MPLHLIASAQKPLCEQLKEAGGWKSYYMVRKDDDMTLDVHRQIAVQNIPH